MMWVAAGIIAVAWVLSLIFATILGNKWHKITAKIENIETKLEEKAANIPLEIESEPEHKSSMIDPNNAIEVAQWEMDEAVRKVNR